MLVEGLKCTIKIVLPKKKDMKRPLMLHTHLKYTENANNCRFYDATDFQFPI